MFRGGQRAGIAEEESSHRGTSGERRGDATPGIIMPKDARVPMTPSLPPSLCGGYAQNLSRLAEGGRRRRAGRGGQFLLSVVISLRCNTYRYVKKTSKNRLRDPAL